VQQSKVFVLLCRQQAVTGKLSQTEHWSSLTPLEQQQVMFSYFEPVRVSLAAAALIDQKKF
jgi:hypothetical protein